MTDDERPADRLRRIALELAAMAQTGTAYATDRYDSKRYARLSEIAAELHGGLVGVSPEQIMSRLEIDGGYATPHVDVRGVLVGCGQVLLVREASDGLWTLPGGWADVLDTPRAAIEREFAEEAGLAVRATRLAFVHDGTVSNGHLRAPGRRFTSGSSSSSARVSMTPSHRPGSTTRRPRSVSSASMRCRRCRPLG